MTEYGKAQIQALGAGLGGFVVVVGVGAALMLHHGGSAVKAPVSAYAPVDAASALSAPAAVKSERAGTPLGATGAVASSPAPLLPASERAAEASAAPSAAPASPRPVSAAPAFSRKLVVTQHLDGTSSATSSAKATVAKAKVRPAERPAQKPFLPPKLDLTKTQSALASSIHYGVSSRAELMGRAAGPVYNFSGKSMQRQAPQGGLSAASAVQQVDAAQQQIDDSSLDASDKAALKENLGQVRQAVQSNGASQ